MVNLIDGTNVTLTVADNAGTNSVDVTVAASAASGITDLTSTGGTITVTTPTGPTTNVDLPASGVTAGTYGDATHVARVTIDAEGRATAASNVAITGGGGVTSLDSITGAVALVAGSNITITDNSPIAGDITIAATGSTGTPTDGWVDDTAETWTYVSATSFKVTGVDVTAKYRKGARIKLTQTTVKYFVVTASAFAVDTTVTITGGTSYTLANAAIAANYHSYITIPQGYPFWFNYTPTFTGFSVNPGITLARFATVGLVCYMDLNFSFGTSNATTFLISLPITADSTTGSGVNAGFVAPVDNGVALTTPGVSIIAPSSTTIDLRTSLAAAGWTASGNKGVNFPVWLTYSI